MGETKSDAASAASLDDYRERVTDAYEGEIFGAAFFEALRERFGKDPELHRKCEIMRDIEVATEKRLEPVVARLKLPASDRAKLEASGRAAAQQVTAWTPFIDFFHKAAPGYVAKFEELAAVAPVQDREVAAFLVEHEVAFVSFTEKETAGAADSTAHLERLLKTAR
jgi:hypothetical protein